MFVRTLDNLRQQNFGFETGNLVTFGLDPANAGYSEERTGQTVLAAIEKIGQLPGIKSVAATSDPELAGDSEHSDFLVEGNKTTEDESPHLESPRVTAGYFATLGQPLLAGREFTAADAKDAPKVAVVNLEMAKKYFGSAQNAVGHMVSEGSKLDTTIVGVVGDSKHKNLRTTEGAAVYQPYQQQEHPQGMQIYVRTSQAPEAVESEIRQVVQGMDPTLVVDQLRTMESQVNASAGQERALAILAIGFAGLALLLAAVGLYGVLAYSTEQRTREIGVRLALGSPRWDVVMLVVREMLIIAAIAAAVAVPTIVALARAFRSQLYGVTTADPVSLLAAVAIPALMVVLAAALPAGRAASVNPSQALRTE